MKILVACEFSGRVRDAFIRLGHDAVSCDLLPTEQPGPHIQADIRAVLDAAHFDMIVAFPPCTHLCSSGARYFKQKQADGRQQGGIDFFMLFANHPCERIAIENPVGIMSRLWRKPDQIIQPWMFGHSETKATCLWLKNLPRLEPTNVIKRPPAWRMCPMCENPWCLVHDKHVHDCSCKETHLWEVDPFVEGGRFDNETPSGQNKLGPSPERAKIRSTTYQGIADAMAEQWAGNIATSPV